MRTHTDSISKGQKIFSIKAWNACGFKRKAVEVIKDVNTCDIFGVSEIQMNDNELPMDMEMKDYLWEGRSHPTNTGKPTGGVGVYIKRSALEQGWVEVMETSMYNRLWMKIKGGDGMNDTYVCNVYGPVGRRKAYLIETEAQRFGIC